MRLRDAAPRTGERRSRQNSRDHCRRFPSRGKHPRARAPTVERADAGESFSSWSLAGLGARVSMIPCIAAAETAMTPHNVSGNAPVACRRITVAQAALLCSLKSKPGPANSRRNRYRHFVAAFRGSAPVRESATLWCHRLHLRQHSPRTSRIHVYL